ncbi:hypothetical protein G9P44_003010 [Scheffersomyces stipitis]|nr:hypothetical protein G9P44_003010 [Scheffersomyces stipitis]
MAVQTYEKSPSTTIYHKLPLKINNDRARDTSSILVMIPGNPGLIEFYTTYLDLIQTEFPALEVLCISHAGFQTSEPVNSEKFKFYDLEYQIKHKFDIISEFITQKLDDGYNNVELYFLSHSVGSYVHQRVIRMLLQEKELHGKFSIKFTGLICPTIVDIAQSDNGQFFTKLFSLLPIISISLWVAWLLNTILPEAMAKSIIAKRFVEKPKSNDTDSVESWQNSVTGAYKLYSSQRLIEQALNLARQEMLVITRDDIINDWFFQQLSEIKIWTFFAEKDHWVHNSSRDYTLRKYHDLTNNNLLFEVGSSEDAITHSFCVNQSVEFSKLTIKAIRSLDLDIAYEN